MQWKMTATITMIAGLSLAGCAKDATKAEFGDAVRHMTEHQVYDRDAAYNPNPAPVLGGDVERLNSVLESHRNDFGYGR
jgi:hypothetical protein